MKKNLTLTFSLLCVAALAIATPVFAQEFTVDREQAAYNEPDYSPFVDQNYPDRIFWGDNAGHGRLSGGSRDGRQRLVRP